MNELQKNKYYLHQLLYELEMLNEDIRFVISNIDIHDEEAFKLLNSLSKDIHRIELVQPEYDDIKLFCGFQQNCFADVAYLL